MFHLPAESVGELAGLAPDTASVMSFNSSNASSSRHHHQQHRHAGANQHGQHHNQQLGTKVSK